MTSQLSPWPFLRQGDEAQAVRDVQYLLRDQGYVLDVDSIFGSVTDATVRTIQKDRHLAVDGIVGPNTWSAMIIEVAHGSQGDPVRAVQEELKVRAHLGNPDFDIEVDGVFGPRTGAAVRAFQEGVSRAVQSFPVDGIVGPLTWQALTGGMLAD
jgi:peptidoglycan hydrolase-like protein with peptidoglycan-binding domain